MAHWKSAVFAAWAALVCVGALAAEGPLCEKHSPAHTVALLELYTSEGCDSCPPADAFVRGLYGSGFSAEEVVPLALHVDYWDSLGWKDRFASAQFTQRQYWLTKSQTSGVYTPEIFLAGREARDWRGGNFKQTVRSINAQPARVALELSQWPAGPGRLAIKASAVALPGLRSAPLGLYLALYENDLTSDVKAGENRGATLRHSFVVRQWQKPLALDENGNATTTWDQKLPADLQPGNIGVVAFVGNTSTGEVLQALALPACAAH